MVGRVAKKYSVNTTTISTENPTFNSAVPTPKMPPSRFVMFALLEANRLTSVVITVATSNSSSIARKKSDSMKSLTTWGRSEEHTSELQSRGHLVCRLLLEKK